MADVDERQSDLAVMSANEFKQKSRLESILEALTNVEETADEAWELLVVNEITTDAKNIMVQRAVQKAIRECYNLLRQHHKKFQENGSESPTYPYWAGSEEEPIGTIERSHADDIVVYGLYHYLHLDYMYSETVTQTIHPDNKPPQTVTRQIEYTVPEEVSQEAFLKLKEFLEEVHDMEIQFEEMKNDLPVWGFEEIDPDEVDDDVEVI